MNVTVAGTTVSIAEHRIDGDIKEKLEAYMRGERAVFDDPVDLADLTAFQQRVLAAMRQIPYGETVTYSELAESIGNPDAVRAVGTACGVNPVPIVIPCHRVVGKNGLGGYAYGQDVKERLLRLECADVFND